ncbi:MAG TPA: hypothetical protein DIT13_06415 [Verrucomicrobiales bacterium]|nr:hypothetical protein [Verrucomicrobiales bacterium]HRJ08574.1 hypothetical protein [Prosthecobacter sp.]HRK13327.1 hypothetical protein [Prosthecobacter sp.]
MDAVPAITSAVVDQVETLAVREASVVTASGVNGVLHLSFGIPQGSRMEPKARKARCPRKTSPTASTPAPSHHCG